MAPTSRVELAPPILMQRGISGLKYLERFGGYGRQRELGLLQHQVMTVFDFLMEAAARDALALLAAAIEQSCLDGGHMDLATLLTLQEDPPSSIFQNRQLSSTSRSRSFAPLADQRWVTCSLAFLERDGGDCVEASGAYRRRRKGHFRSFIRSAEALKGKATPKKKGKGRGQTAPEEVDGQ